MRVRVYSIRDYQLKSATRMVTGLRKHGVTSVVLSRNVNDVRRHRPTDLAVIWGFRHPDMAGVFDIQREHGLPTLVMEGGYIGNRFEWTALGYDGINGRADFLNDDCPSDRWEEHFSHGLRPWRHDGSRILLCGQVYLDASIRKLGVSEKRYERIAKGIRRHTDLPVHFRPHPAFRQTNPVNVDFTEDSKTVPIATSLSSVRCSVSINSISGVDSIMNGTPAICLDEGSMVWDVAGHEIADVANPPMPDRTDWGRRIGYTQWHLDEIESGLAWEHLKRKFE